MPVTKREALTAKKIAAAIPQASPFWLRDSTVAGLALRVLPSGRKIYAVLWGRGKALTIGVHPVMTLESARTHAKRVLGEVAAHGAPVATLAIQERPQERITLGDYIRERYGPHVEATAKAGKATTAALKSVFGTWYEKPIAEVSLLDWDTLKAGRLKSGTRPATVNRDLDRIKAALSQAEEWQLLQKNPLAKVKRIKRGIESRVRHLSGSEEKRIRNALQAREERRHAARTSADVWRNARDVKPFGPYLGYTDHLLPMTLLALNTGLRRGELTQLVWSDIDLKAKRLTVRAGYAKSGKERHVPLNSEAVAVLKQHKKQGDDGGRLFGVAAVTKSWANLMTAAKVDGFRFHDCRHTFASKLVMAGVDLNTVRELLGHSDITMTLRYAHLAPEHKAAAVETLVAGKAGRAAERPN